MITNNLVHPDPTIERYRPVRVRDAYVARPNDLVLCQTLAGAIGITLPAGVTAGACIAVGDDDGNAQANAITISSAALIDGAASASIDTAGGLEQFIFDGSTWSRISSLFLVSAPKRDIPVTLLAALKKALGVEPAGFTIVRDIDFASLPNQALNVDGAVVIAGDNWTKRGSASEISTSIVNGTGLVIVPANGSDSAYGGFAMPRLDLPLDALLPADAYGPGMRVRISIWDVTSMAGLTQFPAAVYGAYWNTAGASGFWVQRGINAPGQGMGFTGGDSGGGSYAARNWVTPLGVNNEVQEILMPAFGSAEAMASYGAASGGTFPLRSQLTPFSVFSVDSGGLPVRTALSNARLFLGARRTTSANPINATIKRVRVEYAL